MGIWCSVCVRGVVVSRGNYIKECNNVHATRKRQEVSFQFLQNTLIASSHLVKHTDVVITSLRSLMMVMHLGTSHTHIRLSRRCC